MSDFTSRYRSNVAAANRRNAAMKSSSVPPELAQLRADVTVRKKALNAGKVPPAYVEEAKVNLAKLEEKLKTMNAAAKATDAKLKSKAATPIANAYALVPPKWRMERMRYYKAKGVPFTQAIKNVIEDWKTSGKATDHRAGDEWTEKKGVCKGCGAKTGIIESAIHKPFWRDHNAADTHKRCPMSLKPIDGSSGKYKKAKDARKARLHRALDAAIDRRVARDAVKCPACGESANVRALTSPGVSFCTACEKSFKNKEAAKDSDEWPVYTCITKDGKKHLIVAKDARMANTIAEQKFGYANISVAPQESLKSAKDEYHYAEKPKQPKPIVTFLDRIVARKAAEAEAAKGKDAATGVGLGNVNRIIEQAKATVANEAADPVKKQHAKRILELLDGKRLKRLHDRRAKDEAFKIGEKVHLGFGQARGAGFEGVVEKVEGDRVWVRALAETPSPFGAYKKLWKGPAKNISRALDASGATVIKRGVFGKGNKYRILADSDDSTYSVFIDGGPMGECRYNGFKSLRAAEAELQDSIRLDEKLSKAKDAKVDPKEKQLWDRDSDYGSAKIVLREKASGAEAIAKKYGFSLSFIKEVLAGKYGRSDAELKKNLTDVAPVGDKIPIYDNAVAVLKETKKGASPREICKKLNLAPKFVADVLKGDYGADERAVRALENRMLTEPPPPLPNNVGKRYLVSPKTGTLKQVSDLVPV